MPAHILRKTAEDTLGPFEHPHKTPPRHPLQAGITADVYEAYSSQGSSVHVLETSHRESGDETESSTGTDGVDVARSLATGRYSGEKSVAVDIR